MKKYIFFFLVCLLLSGCSSVKTYSYIEEEEKFLALSPERTDEEKKEDIQNNPQMVVYSGISLGLTMLPLYDCEIEDILNKEEIKISIDKKNNIAKVTLPLTISKRKASSPSSNREEDIELTKKVIWEFIEDLLLNNYDNPLVAEVEIIDVNNEAF